MEIDKDIEQENLAILGAGTRNITSFQSQFPSSPIPFKFIPLIIEGGAFKGDYRTSELLSEIGGVDTLLKITKLFYEKFFKDKLLDTFIRNHSEPHFQRLGTWIAEKMDPLQDLWTQERRARSNTPVRVGLNKVVVVNDRQSAHLAAWLCPKRCPADIGQHFRLHDARVWMRLMFWSARETGIFQLSPSFADWYVRFIAHFIRIYDDDAPQFARESYRWSENQENIDQYLRSCTNGKYSMPNDVCTEQEVRDVIHYILPTERAEVTSWPYNRKP